MREAETTVDVVPELDAATLHEYLILSKVSLFEICNVKLWRLARGARKLLFSALVRGVS